MASKPGEATDDEKFDKIVNISSSNVHAENSMEDVFEAERKEGRGGDTFDESNPLTASTTTLLAGNSNDNSQQQFQYNLPSFYYTSHMRPDLGYDSNSTLTSVHAGYLQIPKQVTRRRHSWICR